ncbi:MAG: hypothetical protein AAF485_17050, partial [Chloroflexota bacterium]
MDVQKHLNQLESTGLISLADVDPDIEYLFRHALVQDAAYGSLLRQDRADLHRLVGEALERLYPKPTNDVARVLGRHFEQAGDMKRALKYFIKAGDADADIYANVEAIAFYEQALTLTQKEPALIDSEQLINLYLRCGRALELNVEHNKALTLYQTMVRVAQDRNDLSMELAALMAQATIRAIFTPVQNSDEGQTLAERALQLAEDLNDYEAKAKTLLILMLVNVGRDEHVQAVEFGERSLAIAREHNLTEQIAYTLNDIQFSYQSTGRLDKARQVLDEAHGLWRTLDNIPMLTDNLSRKTFANYFAGDFEKVLSASDEAFQLSQATNNLWGMGFSRYILGPVYMDQGEFGKTLQLFDDVLGLTNMSHLVSSLAIFRVY